MFPLVELLKEARPSSPALIFFAVAAPALWLMRRPGSGTARRVLAAVLIVYWLLATRIGSTPLVLGLSHGLTRVTSAADARGADVVVVLSGGGATYRVAGLIGGAPAPNTVLRALEGVRVFRLIGARELIVSGGKVRVEVDLRPESGMLRDAVIRAGIPPDRVVEESSGRNTREEAAAVKRILGARERQPFVLVTSPTHMRRALRAFRAAGLDPVPSTAPLRSEHLGPPPLLIPSMMALDESDAAVYDYAATIYYQLTGWSKPPQP